MARFGDEKAKSFQDLRRIVIEIQVSASRLAEIWSQAAFSKDDGIASKKERNTHELIIWEHGKSDAINIRVEKVISDIEEVCRPIIMGKKSS